MLAFYEIERLMGYNSAGDDALRVVAARENGTVLPWDTVKQMKKG
jgi:hypothetical protein